MILNKGELDGHRILSEDTARLIFENAVPDQAMPIGERATGRGLAGLWGVSIW